MNDFPAPRPAYWLGYLGLLPFVTGAGAAWFGPPVLAAWAEEAMLLYAALILSFIGAVHWGLAMQSTHSARDKQLGLSVIPALVGWLAVLLPPLIGFPILIVSFSVMSGVDRQSVLAGVTPAWYPGLRLPLTIVAVFSLGFAWLRLVFG